MARPGLEPGTPRFSDMSARPGESRLLRLTRAGRPDQCSALKLLAPPRCTSALSWSEVSREAWSAPCRPLRGFHAVSRTPFRSSAAAVVEGLSHQRRDA